MNTNFFKATAFMVLIGSMLTSAMVAPMMLGSVGIDSPNLIIRVVADDLDPGSECGVLNILVMDKDSTADLDSEITESHADVWAHFGAGAGWPSGTTELTGDVPYNQEFMIVVKTEYNYTVAYNVSASSWDKNYVEATLQSSDLDGRSSATEMSKGDFHSIAAGTSAVINFHDDNSASGWAVAHGETVTMTITIKGFW
jgi:hypothetical protein